MDGIIVFKGLKKLKQRITINVKLNFIIKKIDELSQQTGEIILRDLRSSFKSLEDYSASKNNPKDNLLSKIEDGFLRNTGLDGELHTNSVKNSKIIALSYLGLAKVRMIYEDYDMVSRYIFRMFESDPRYAREELAPEIFESLIKPHCAELYNNYNRRIKKIAHVGNYITQGVRGTISLGATIAGPLAAITAGLLFPPSRPALKSFVKESSKFAEKVWDKGNPESKEWWITKNGATEDFEKKIDEKTIEVLKGLMSNCDDEERQSNIKYSKE